MEQLVTVITEDLRLALLLIGVVLVIGIIVWEVVQRRRAKRAEQEYLKGPLGVAREQGNAGESQDPLFRPDPSLGPDASPLGEIRSADASRRAEPTLTLPQISTRDRLIEPPLIDLDVAMRRPVIGSGLPIMQTTAPAVDCAPEPVAEPVAEPAREPVSEPAPEPVAAPRLELPAEERRVIVALRVVARGGERFTGASLRQALQGEGFVHGDMAIFHRIVADGRVLLSAASLTNPGNFDLETMDSSLFLGINVFAVLPGPLPGRDAVDKLLLAGHTLAQRLKGELYDAKGQPLTESRLAEMRREAAAAAG